MKIRLKSGEIQEVSPEYAARMWEQGKAEFVTEENAGGGKARKAKETGAEEAEAEKAQTGAETGDADGGKAESAAEEAGETTERAEAPKTTKAAKKGKG